MIQRVKGATIGVTATIKPPYAGMVEIWDCYSGADWVKRATFYAYPEPHQFTWTSVLPNQVGVYDYKVWASGVSGLWAGAPSVPAGLKSEGYFTLPAEIDVVEVILGPFWVQASGVWWSPDGYTVFFRHSGEPDIWKSGSQIYTLYQHARYYFYLVGTPGVSWSEISLQGSMVEPGKWQFDMAAWLAKRDTLKKAYQGVSPLPENAMFFGLIQAPFGQQAGGGWGQTGPLQWRVGPPVIPEADKTYSWYMG